VLSILAREKALLKNFIFLISGQGFGIENTGIGHNGPTDHGPWTADP